jgi:hypothetical protein
VFAAARKAIAGIVPETRYSRLRPWTLELESPSGLKLENPKSRGSFKGGDASDSRCRLV